MSDSENDGRSPEDRADGSRRRRRRSRRGLRVPVDEVLRTDSASSSPGAAQSQRPTMPAEAVGSTDAVDVEIEARDSGEILDVPAANANVSEAVSEPEDGDETFPEITADEATQDDMDEMDLAVATDGVSNPDVDMEEMEETLELQEEAKEATPPVMQPRLSVPAAPPPVPDVAPSESAQVRHPGSGARPLIHKPRAWYEDSFNDDYLRTVRGLTPEIIARKCDFIERSLGLTKGAALLDVGCGLGVFSIELASRGYFVVGLDLSLPMLSRAADEAQDRGLRINFLHADMRDMSFDGAFDAVLCIGTTLGYFDEQGNRLVIERLAKALKPNGLLFLDVVNRDHVIRSQPNMVWFEGAGCVCMEETRFDYSVSRLEVKRTVILDDGRQRESLYSIRLYAFHELRQLLQERSLRVTQLSGWEATPGAFFGVESPRLIIAAERVG